MCQRQYNYCDHIGILTANAKKMERFYIDKMGFKKEKEVILPRPDAKQIFGIDSDLTFIRLEQDNMKLELFQPRRFKLCKGGLCGGNHHWGFLVKDRRVFRDRLKRKKVKINEINRGSHVAYFVPDPDGNMIELRDLG